MAKGAYIGIENFPKRKLPSGYTQVEYIELTGTQYVDTQYAIVDATELYFDVQLTTTAGAWQRNGIGSPFGTINRFHVDMLYNYQYHVGVGSYFKNFGTVDLNRHTLYLKASNGVFRVDDEEYQLDGANRWFDGATWYVGQRDNEYSKEKVYGVRFVENGATVYDGVPCINPNGEAGLYDVVGNVFRGNSGTGTLLTGQVYSSVARKIKKGYISVENFPKRNLPSGYTQVEYIQSSGTQFINTGYKANNNTRIVADHEVISSNNGSLFGSWDGVLVRCFIYLLGGTGTQIAGFYDNQEILTNIDWSGRRTIDANKNVWKLDGTTIVTFTEAQFQATSNLFLFGYNTGGALGDNAPSAKMYSCQIYDNDTLVRDYVPCINPDGVAGMYDLVSSQFYGNAGTGSFVASSTSDVARKIKKAYIGIGGVARPCWAGGEPTAMFYGDGTLIFQLGDSIDSAHGTLIASYTGFDIDVYTTSTQVPWNANREAITSVIFKDTISPIATAFWFGDCKNLTGIDLTHLDTSNVTDMRSMFSGCKNLTSLDVSGFDTSNVTDMQSMFSSCYNVTSLDVSGFDTSNVTDMRSMFSGCNNVTSLDVSGFDTSNVTYMQSMFAWCYLLENVDLSGFDTGNVTNMHGMFYLCKVLTSLDLSSFDTSNVTTMSTAFQHCYALKTIYASERWSIANVTAGKLMFDGAEELVGAISYDSTKTDYTYANYTTGYFTYKAAS